MSHTVRLTLDGHLAREHRALKKSGTRNVVMGAKHLFICIDASLLFSLDISKEMEEITLHLMMSECITIELCLP